VLVCPYVSVWPELPLLVLHWRVVVPELLVVAIPGGMVLSFWLYCHGQTSVHEVFLF